MGKISKKYFESVWGITPEVFKKQAEKTGPSLQKKLIKTNRKGEIAN